MYGYEKCEITFLIQQPSPDNTFIAIYPGTPGFSDPASHAFPSA